MQHLVPSSLAPRRRLASALAAALLAGSGLCAHAALVTFTGAIDSGPLDGAVFSGSFSYSDPLPGFDGAVGLDTFALSFAGQSYTLATVNPGTVPDAFFAAGRFVGVDYRDTGAADPGTRPHVYLTAGFSDPSEAFLGYDTTGNGVQGFGSYVLAATPNAVPESGSFALALVGLGCLGALSRRRG
jgi:hypothetical protein